MQQLPSDNAPDLPSGLSLGWAAPDDDGDDTRLWLRWDAAEICYVRLLAAAPHRYPGHWVPAVRGYRLCTSPACPYCGARRAARPQTREMASERRWRYLVTVEKHSGGLAIWEFGDAVARQLQRLTGYHRAEDGTETRDRCTLGLALGLCREGARDSRGVLLALADGVTWSPELPAPLPVAQIMADLWRRAAIHDGKGQPRLPIGF